jgi:hypothetical protein
MSDTGVLLNSAIAFDNPHAYDDDVAKPDPCENTSLVRCIEHGSTFSFSKNI